jgi:flagella basal body P-ring formation protein FlgA
VLDAIRPYGLTSIDTAGIDAVVVTRPSRPITAEEIKQRIREALAGQQGLGGTAGDLRLALDQSLRTINVESSATGELQVARLAFSPGARRFDITLFLPGSALLHRSPLRLTGTVVETAEAVVLARAIKRGQVIRPDDVVAERRPRVELGEDRVGGIDLAVGMAAQRPLHSGQALKQSDLMRPEMVQRNEMVTLVFEVPGVTLTMRGKALETGAEGDTIGVVNLESKRTVQGTITGAGRVTVIGAMNGRRATHTASLQPDSGSPSILPRNLQPE